MSSAFPTLDPTVRQEIARHSMAPAFSKAYASGSVAAIASPFAAWFAEVERVIDAHYDTAFPDVGAIDPFQAAFSNFQALTGGAMSGRALMALVYADYLPDLTDEDRLTLRSVAARAGSVFTAPFAAAIRQRPYANPVPGRVHQGPSFVPALPVRRRDL